MIIFFSDTADGTLMKDVFHFQSPVGVLGRFADAVFMKKYLTRFLKERNQLIKEFAETGRGIAMLEATKNLNFKEQAGVFSFTDEGFVLQEKQISTYHQWATIETIIAYKEDRLTTDEIVLSLVAGRGTQIYITESYPGWDRFLENLQKQFPSIAGNWEINIIQPSFATNLTLLYDRQQRPPEQVVASLNRE